MDAGFILKGIVAIADPPVRWRMIATGNRDVNIGTPLAGDIHPPVIHASMATPTGMSGRSACPSNASYAIKTRCSSGRSSCRLP